MVALKDITLFELGNNNLLMVSKFIRIARIEEGVNIRLNDKGVICKVLSYGQKTDNPKLKRMYRQLKASISKYIREQKIPVDLCPDSELHLDIAN